MGDDSFSTRRLLGWVDRIQDGDAAAEDELLRRVGERLERLARKMLNRFPGVRRWADTGDVLQNACPRLLRALRQVRPADSRAFFCLAAEQMRRELLDLARHFQGVQYGRPSAIGDVPSRHGATGRATGPFGFWRTCPVFLP